MCINYIDKENYVLKDVHIISLNYFLWYASQPFEMNPQPWKQIGVQNFFLNNPYAHLKNIVKQVNKIFVRKDWTRN